MLTEHSDRDAAEFIATHGVRDADGALSPEVTSLLLDAIGDGHPPLSPAAQRTAWVSAVSHGADSVELASACDGYRESARTAVWRRIAEIPETPIPPAAARIYATALAGDDVARLAELVGRTPPGAGLAGGPGAAAMSVALHSPHDDVLGTLRDRAPADFRLIPCGRFTMGGGLKADENPAHAVWLPSIYLARYPVTVADYRRYVEASGESRPAPAGAADWPAWGLNWEQARRFARWRGGRLPSEAEWEKAARGRTGKRYPWGERFEVGRANTREGGHGELVAVDRYEGRGDSDFGIVDMVGNAWEWTASRYAPYGARIKGADHRPLDQTTDRVLRGGAYDFDEYGCNCLNRYRCDPSRGWDTHGFRLALA